VTLLPASTARPLLLAAVSITSADRLLSTGAQLVARAVPLPIDPAGVRDLLLKQAGLSPDVAASLDLGSPAGAAVVATGGRGKTGVVMAVAARGPAEADRVIAGLGRTVMRRGPVALVDNGSGQRGWVFRAGSVVVLSDQLDALARGAMLALEARHPAADDVTAVLYPDAIAHANGTTVKAAMAQMADELNAVKTAVVDARRQKDAPSEQTYTRATESAIDVMSLLADAETVEVGLSVNVARGLVLQARLYARPGSALAGLAREARPFQLDRAVLDGGAPALLGGSSYGPLIQKVMARQRERLAADVAAADPKDRAPAAALKFFEVMTGAMAGQVSFSSSFTGQPARFSAALIYPLKDAASAAKLAGALSGLDHDAAVVLWEAQVGPNPMFGWTVKNPSLDWTVKKETVGKLKALHYTLKLHHDLAGATSVPEIVKVFGPLLDAYVTVAGTRMVASLGQGAKARLVALASGKSGAPPAAGPLADTLGTVSGRDGFCYLDLSSVVSIVATFAKDARATALASGPALPPIPVLGTIGGDGAGKAWTVDLTLPASAFTGAGAVIQRFTAAAAGASSQ
jgi:hypothetical protein